MTKIVTILFLLMFLSWCSSSAKKAENKGHRQVQEAVSMDVKPFIPELSDKLYEISGLLVYDDLFWGFNDSGGDETLFGFDKTGGIKKEVKLKDAKNHDWESITQDKKHIYIGDFGNNTGNRKNLNILKIKKKDIDGDKKQKIKAKTIGFVYKEQKQFGYRHLSTPFDCEAMVAFGDSLYIFSKDWASGTTVVYQIPKKKGDYHLAPADTFDVKGLITGADINPSKNKLALVGYENYHSFIWLFTDFEGSDFFSGESLMIRLPNLDDAQTEGISFWGNDSLLVSCEHSRGIKQQVFVVDLKKLNSGTH